MERLKFTANGRLASVDGKILDFSEDSEEVIGEKLRTSQDMQFLKEEKAGIIEDEKEFWNLYSNNSPLQPLRFTNGKTQEDVVREVVSLIKKGRKAIFIHGACGSGKSAIALNIARVLGKTSIVVPVKGLQRQYEEDYTDRKYLIKNGIKLKIAVISGRDNHDSIIEPGTSCADPFLPDTIKFIDKNRDKLLDYYERNPYIKGKEMPEVRKLKRMAVAPANPYWSPIIASSVELSALKDAKKIKYTGLNGKEFTIYHRKQGCSYYDQYLAYNQADVIIFNSAKYKIEVALNRKPLTEVDIIDEADEFLDNFTTQEHLNLSRLHNSLKGIRLDDYEQHKELEEIIELLHLEEKNKEVTGIDEEKIIHVKDTKIGKIFKLMIKNAQLQAEIEMDDMNYGNKALEAALEFKDFLDEAYVTYYRNDKDLCANIVTTNLSRKFHEVIDKNKAMVFMSGTLHSHTVLKKIFGLNEFDIVDAETSFLGAVEIQRTGKEFDCRYSNFGVGKYSREQYLRALSLIFDKAKKPVLVHVNSYEDLPSQKEINDYQIYNLISKEALRENQIGDKTGKAISNFKEKKIQSLFSTKCARGVDFPGDTCNSIIFTKYPNPNVNDIFWKLLKKEHSNYYWEFYMDKARREFLQRIFRAVRSKDDHVFILSPDMRVLQAVSEMQKNMMKAE